MIAGAVRNLEPVIGLDVLGADHQAHFVEAVVDTGYNGYLIIPGDTLSGLQLSFAGHRRGRLADR
jgi:predicted aspartyl protease